jgi:acyl-CoA thioesterase
MSMEDENALALEIARTMLSREGTGPAWGIEIEGAGPGFSRIAMTLTPAMLNGHRNAHGGMIFALADTAFAYACNSRNQTSVAQQASITFIDAGRAGERLTAEAREVASKGRSGVFAVTIFGEDGRVVAQMQALSRTVGGPVIEISKEKE